jgi:hypothetical protein
LKGTTPIYNHVYTDREDILGEKKGVVWLVNDSLPTTIKPIEIAHSQRMSRVNGRADIGTGLLIRRMLYKNKTVV